jgi:hypothetical protein
MYTFQTIVSRVDGKSGEVTLMIGEDEKVHKATPRLCQYFQRAGMQDVSFFSAAGFCEYLQAHHFKDKRTVFFRERVDSRNLEVLSTSPFNGYDNEIFLVGEFIFEED